MENARYVPAVTRTVPPPAAAASSIALLMAGLSRAFPSPFAPYFRMSKAAVNGELFWAAVKALETIARMRRMLNGLNIGEDFSHKGTKLQTQGTKGNHERGDSLCLRSPLCAFA